MVHIPPLRATLSRFGQRFTHRVFTEGEIAYCQRQHDPAQSYAARFAAKEAAIKALGIVGSPAVMRGIEVSDPAPSLAPSLKLSGAVVEGTAAPAPTSLSLSLSHDGDYAVGAVLAIRCTTDIHRRGDDDG